MATSQITVRNKSGLHARPAAAFAAAAAKFQSKITLRNLDKDMGEANAKSVYRVLKLAVKQGTRIEITAEGHDETSAVDTLVALTEEGFGEL